MVWILGLPHPELWGLFGFLLRFVPYIGALMAAAVPTLIAFAVFPGWSKAIEVLAAYIVFDQLAAHFVEPFLIGPGIGISPVALLVSAMYWSWLWGPAGLILATPITACIKVAGDYVPALSFFTILLGCERPLQNHHEYYRSLLELDRDSAHGLVVRYGDEYGLNAAFDEVLIPAIITAADEFSEGNISYDNLHRVIGTSRELIVELGNRQNKIERASRLRVLGMCAPGEAHSIALLILLQLARQHDVAASFVSEHKSVEELHQFTCGFAPDLVCVSSTIEEYFSTALALVRSLKSDSPQIVVIAGGSAALSHANDLYAAGCAQVCATINEGRQAIRSQIWKRARTRMIAKTDSGHREELTTT